MADRRKGAAIGVVALACIPSFLFLLGVFLIFDQAGKLSTWVPTDAEVLDARIEVRSGRSKSFAPVITYRYEVGGRPYVSRVLGPVKQSGRKRWAQDVVRRFGAGGRVKAWVHPSDPSRAFLLHEASFLPYGFVLISLAICSLVVLLRHLECPAPPRSVDRDGEWLALRPDRPLARRVAGGYLVGLSHVVIAGLLAAHWFQLLSGSASGLCIAAFVLSAALGMTAVLARLQVSRLMARVEEARIHIHGALAEPGSEAQIRVELRVVGELRIETLALGLLRQEVQVAKKQRRGYGRRVRASEVAIGERHALSGETLEASATVRVPELPPLDHPNPAMQVETRVELVLRAANGPDYRQSFGVPASSGGPVKDGGKPADRIEEELGATVNALER